MNVAQAKQKATEWVRANRDQWPGLRAAHFVGSITTMTNEADFPAYKDVDMHLIFDEDSPMLVSESPFAHILEVPYRGLIIEAGLKPVSDYRDAEAVLANPELAHHFTVDSAIYDPDGLLANLRQPVTRDYALRKWVLARIEHERRGLEGVLAMLPLARQAFGFAGEANLLGYSMTRVSALFSDVTLRSPTTGSRMLLRMRDVVTEYGRPELYDEALAILGLERVEPEVFLRRLEEGAQAFDLAVKVKRTPMPFEHKLNPHQRGYFVDACRALFNEGHVREAMGWLSPFYLACTAVILADGPDASKPYWSAKLKQFLSDLGMATPEQCDRKLTRAKHWQEACFALAEAIVEQNPAITDEVEMEVEMAVPN